MNVSEPVFFPAVEYCQVELQLIHILPFMTCFVFKEEIFWELFGLSLECVFILPFREMDIKNKCNIYRDSITHNSLTSDGS